MGKFTTEKKIILNYFQDLEEASPSEVRDVLEKYMDNKYSWKGVYPFREQEGVEKVTDIFWRPLKKSIKHMQRRQDIFIAGTNEISNEKWVMSMGHFMGLFDSQWLGIRPTGKMVNIRYAEFNCLEDNKITKTGMFVDIIGFMKQVGINPLPPETGEYFVYPGPRNHDGLLLEDADETESRKTLSLINEMVEDLNKLNESGSMDCPPELLERTWSKNMIWYGPAGIGASYTIPRYQIQHQLPFRNNLQDKVFNGHECRFAEGKFACFFGWPNLSNTPIGGFLGLPGGKISADMQVVDIYCREGDKLSENWVFIDIPFWLKQQGVDIIERTHNIYNPNSELM
ncbi:polyketide cyclase [Oceanobacillus oncorhynchi subsp. incaldanensis]|uniref:hypothetical protein n=1 Tax=Oceanobacillus oncorhynchi TaxID=545501 RepID=UPI001AFD1B81|nr:hypothetical protein [Oceanobacillus oncorhynchi]GIO20260.1 polyketide cyclase [Oceanobacillus oncorhynchi subsp. incaldanensis]